MSNRHRKRPPLKRVGAGTLVAVTVALLAVWLGPRALATGFTLRALFSHANNVHAGDPVRIAGIDAGHVVTVSPAGNATTPATRVTMTITSSGLPIHEDAQLTIRQRTFLEGTIFVDLQPGSPSAPVLRTGQMIPASQTSGTVQLDQILSDFPGDTRRSLQSLLQGLSRGLAGPGARGFNHSIPYWLSAYRDSAEVNESLLGLHSHDLSDYLKYGGQTAAALDRDPIALRALVTGFNHTAEGFARYDLDLSAAVAELPLALKAASPALRTLDYNLPSFRGLVASMRPALRAVSPALSAGVPLLDQLDALVQPSELPGLEGALHRAVAPLTRLSQETAPLFEQVRLASSCQNNVIGPWSRMTIRDSAFPSTGAVYQDFPKASMGVDGEAREFDANEKIDRALIQGANYATVEGPGQMLLTSIPLLGVNPPVPEQWPQFEPSVPCETQEAPDLRSDPTMPSAQQPVAPTNLATVDHYRDLAISNLLRAGGPAARTAAAVLMNLLSPGGGFLREGKAP